MFAGMMASITWAMATIVLGIVLKMSAFCTTEQAMFLAPFVSTFLHDTFSAIWITFYNGMKGNLRDVGKAFRTKNGKWIVVAAIIGGPMGMTGYVLAVKYMGASLGAVASAVYPAIGTALAYIFLKEKVKWYQWLFLLFTLVGVYGLSYSPQLMIENFWLGIMGVSMCAFGWGMEGVFLGKCLKNPEIRNVCALQLRQTTSSLVYGIIILPTIDGLAFTSKLVSSHPELLLYLAIAGLFATVSYLFYYKAIAGVGVSKAMALNVTYCAWAMICSVLVLQDVSVVTPLTVMCSLIVLICGVLAATDFKALLKSKNN